MSRGVMKKMLEILSEQSASQVDLVKAILAAGYGASMGKIDSQYDKFQNQRYERKQKEDELLANKRRLEKIISRLKSDGLIELKTDKRGKKEFALSSKGKNKLNKIKKIDYTAQYKKEVGETFIIISFDIPERLRKKRALFREIIKNLGFELVHQSLWMGKVKIPEGLLAELAEKEILEFIEIFEITKGGSLEKMKK